MAILWQKSQTKYRASSFLARIVSANAGASHSEFTLGEWQERVPVSGWTDLQTGIRGHGQCEETRLLACPALEAENPVCTLSPEEPEEESYDDEIFVIVFLEFHLQFLKIPGWAQWHMPLILALQRQRQGEISVHLRPAWSTLRVLGQLRLHNEKMEREKNSFC